MVEGVEQREECLDPRIRRTRQMLHEALECLLETKSIDRISVGEIADRATLNRATFYDHYPDKFALLEGLVGSRFQALLDARGVVFHGSCPDALRRIILATCEYLGSLPRVPCPDRRQMEQYFEAAVLAVVRALLLRGLQTHAAELVHDPNLSAIGPSPELLAGTLSGAICGGAREWARSPERVPVAEFVESLFALISPIAAPREGSSSGA